MEKKVFRDLWIQLIFLSLAFLLSRAVLAQEAVPVVRFNVSDFIVEGDNPLSPEETRDVLSLFVGEHEGLDGLLEAAAELESTLIKAGHSFHRVVLPQQTLDQGSVTLHVVVFKLANVDVTGNEYFSSENIKASLPGLVAGEVPDTKELSRELSIANSNPAKEITLRLKASTVPDSVDAILAVQDQRPWQFFSTLNNIGTDETGEFRLSGVYQHSNLFNHDSALTLSYTTSPGHVSDVKQYGLNIQLPVYSLSGNLAFYVSRSDVDSGRIEEVFDVSGAGDFIGGSYTHTFHNRGNYRHRASVGVDDKLFENDVDFLGSPIGVDVRSRPLNLSYFGEWRLPQALVNFNLSYSRNLGGGGVNNDAVYALARLGAEQDWEAIRFSANAIYAFQNNWSINLGLNGQYADEPLISGEQFGLGGVNSVRGFDERITAGDKGIRLSLEASTPPLLYNVRLHGFVEGGHVKTLEAPAGQIASENVVALGLGLRWSWTDRLSLTVEYAHEVNDLRATNEGGNKTHLNVFYRF